MADKPDSEQDMLTQNIRQTEVQRRTLKLLNYEDGLWDILLGSVFLMLSVYPVTRSLLGSALNVLLVLVVLAIMVASYTYARRVYAAPRIGVAKIRRTRATTIPLIIATGLVVGTLVLWLATALSPPGIPEPSWGKLPQWFSDLDVDIVVTLGMVGVFSLVAYYSSVPRIYVYGWLLGVGILVSTALELYAGYSFGLPLAIAAGIVLATGIAQFVRFVRRCPVPVEER